MDFVWLSSPSRHLHIIAFLLLLNRSKTFGVEGKAEFNLPARFLRAVGFKGTIGGGAYSCAAFCKYSMFGWSNSNDSGSPSVVLMSVVVVGVQSGRNMLADLCRCVGACAHVRNIFLHVSSQVHPPNTESGDANLANKWATPVSYAMGSPQMQECR